jgi:hypothetical protein
MDAQEFTELLANDQRAFCDEAMRNVFQFFGCLGVKAIQVHTPALKITHPYRREYLSRLEELGVPDIAKYSGIQGAEPKHTVWTAHELHSEVMPRFLRQVAKANQGPVTYIYAIEHGMEGERPHVHFQLGGVAKVSLTSLNNIWISMNGGRPHIRLFDPSRDTGYTYKYIVAQQAFRSGEDYEVLWDTNLWKRDRRHNSLDQSREFSNRQLKAA